MTTAEAPLIAAGPKRGRRWRRRLIGAGVLLALLAAAAVATLPRWIPTEWLRGVIASQLSQLAKRPVDVGAITLDWTRGVEIRDIRVADAATRGGRLIHTQAVRCGLTPWRWLRGGGLDRLELIQPTLHVQIGPGGQLNLASLTAPPPGRPITHHWVFRDATVYISKSEAAAQPVVRIGDVDITIDPATGAATCALLDGRLIRDIRLAQPDGTWTAHADLQVPAAREPPAGDLGTTAETQAFHGDASFAWDDVDLASLPLGWWPAARNVALAGRCSGTIRAGIGADLGHAFELRVDARGVSVCSAGRPPVRIEHAGLSARGVWKPTEDVVALSVWRLELPGIELKGAPAGGDDAAANASPLLIALRGEVPFTLHAHGRADDLSRVRQWWVGAAGGGVELAGGCTFRVDCTYGRQTQRIELHAEGRDLSLHGPDGVNIPQGCPVEAAGTAVIDEAGGRFRIERCSARVGGVSATLAADVPVGAFGRIGGTASAPSGTATADALAAWRRDAWRTGHVRAEISAARLAECVERWPSLREVVETGLSGGVSAGTRETEGGFAVEFDGAADGPRGAARLRLARDAVVRIGDDFSKAAGAPLTLQCSAKLPTRWDDAIGQLSVSLDYGPATLRVLPEESSLRIAATRPAGDGELLDAELRATWRATHLRELLSLLPAVSRRMAQRGGGAIQADGDAGGRLEADAQFLLRDRQLSARVARLSATVDAGQTQVTVGEDFRKPAGRAAAATAEFRYDAEAARHAHRFEATAQMEGGLAEFSARIGGGYADYVVRAKIDDMDRFAEHSPKVLEALRPYDVHGAAEMSVRAALHPDSERYSMEMDATKAEIDVPCANAAASRMAGADAKATVSAFRKRSGVPLRVRIAAARDPAATTGNAATGEQHWSVSPCRVECAGSAVDLSANAALDSGVELREVWRRLCAADARLGDAVRRADVHGSLQLDADQGFANLGWWAARLADEFALRGSEMLQWDSRVEGNRLQLAGAMDLSHLAFRRPGVFGVVSDPGSNIKWDVSLEDWPSLLARANAPGEPAGPAWLDVRDAAVSLCGAAVRMRGRLPLMAHDGRVGVALLGAANLHATVTAADLSRLAKAWEYGGVRPRTGGVQAKLELARDGGGAWRLVDASGQFSAMRVARSTVAQDDLALDGAWSASSRALRCERLALRCGRSDATLTADLNAAGADFASGITGAVTCGSQCVDMAELPLILAQWRIALGIMDAPAEPGDAAMQSISPELRAFAAASDLHVRLRVRDAYIPHLAGAGPFLARELVIAPELSAGALRLPFECAVNGGVVTGRIETMLDEANPYFDLSYEARQLTSEPNTRPLVEAFFPGLGVSGPITLIDATHQRLYDRPGVANPAVGTGEMILGTGTVVGRAAPLVITAIFPRLNLTRFDFARMENRFEKTRDGNMRNHMTFFGRYYDMYVDGVSFPDGRIRYEVGIDLYASLSPSLSRQGQGRIAVFIKTARKGPHNTLLDETVAYLRPDQILGKILSDNLLTQAYHTLSGSFKEK